MNAITQNWMQAIATNPYLNCYAGFDHVQAQIDMQVALSAPPLAVPKTIPVPKYFIRGERKLALD